MDELKDKKVDEVDNNLINPIFDDLPDEDLDTSNQEYKQCDSCN